MALEPIEVEKDGQTVKQDLQAITDGVIAQKAHELDVQAQGARLQIATNDSLQGVLVVDGKDVDPATDEATKTAATQLDAAVAGRDSRLEKVKGTVDKAMTEARVEALKGLAQAWEQDWAGHQAHIDMDENPEQVEASKLAQLVIECAHAVARAEIDAPGTLEGVANAALVAAVDRVAVAEEAKAAEDARRRVVEDDTAPLVGASAHASPAA